MSDLIDRDETIKQFCRKDCGCDPKDCPNCGRRMEEGDSE